MAEQQWIERRGDGWSIQMRPGIGGWWFSACVWGDKYAGCRAADAAESETGSLWQAVQRGFTAETFIANDLPPTPSIEVRWIDSRPIQSFLRPALATPADIPERELWRLDTRIGPFDRALSGDESMLIPVELSSILAAIADDYHTREWERGW